MMVSSAEVHGTEDGVATAAPWPEEEITTGGEMDGFCPRIPSISLYHFHDAAVAFPSSVPTPDWGLRKSYATLPRSMIF